MQNFYTGKTILVTGGVGTIGSYLVDALLKFDIKSLICLDNNESELFFTEQRYIDDPRFVPAQCDICNKYEMMRYFTGVDYIFHTAALKHVPSCERSPFSAIQTNIIGLENIIRIGRRTRVKKILFTSSDKAASPTNVMGATKLLGERLFIAANNSFMDEYGTIFANTRFGNVAGSRGSVIPLFCNQILAGGPVTITSADMTRFVMTPSEATNLVLESMVLAKGGETFITKMQTINIMDLAQEMIVLLAPITGTKDIPCQIVGARPGEKLWEELSTSEESRRLLENDKYLCIMSSTEHMEIGVEDKYENMHFHVSHKIYNSKNESLMTKAEIRTFLLKEGVLPEDIRKKLSA